MYIIVVDVIHSGMFHVWLIDIQLFATSIFILCIYEKKVWKVMVNNPISATRVTYHFKSLNTKPVSRHTTLEIMRCLATDNCDVYRKKSVVMVPFMFDELDSMRLPLPIMKHAVLPLLMLLNSDDILGVGWGGWMYVIIGRHFVPVECKFLLISEVIVRITLNVIVRQMPLNVR